MSQYIENILHIIVFHYQIQSVFSCISRAATKIVQGNDSENRWVNQTERKKDLEGVWMNHMIISESEVSVLTPWMNLHPLKLNMFLLGILKLWCKWSDSPDSLSQSKQVNDSLSRGWWSFFAQTQGLTLLWSLTWWREICFILSFSALFIPASVLCFINAASS